MARDFKTFDVGAAHPNSRAKWFRGIPKKTTSQISALAGMTKGDHIYDTTLNALYHYNGSAWAAVATPSTIDMDTAYNNGSAVTVDATTVAWNGNLAAKDVMTVTNTDATCTKSLIDLTHARTASKDIDGTASSWYVTGAGAGTFASIATGTGAGSIAVNSNKFTVNGTSGNTVVAGTLDSTGNFKVNTTMFTVDASNGNTVIAGNLTVSGSWSISSTFSLGTDGVGVDMNFYSTTAGDNLLWDASEKTLLVTDSKIHLGDNDPIEFGNGSATGTGDFEMSSDGTNLFIRANFNVVVGQTLYIGDSTNELDLHWRSTTSGDYVLFDSNGLTNGNVIFEDVQATFMDNTALNFGDSQDYQISYSDPDLIIRAGADVADQAVKIGTDTNDIDFFVYGDTAGDYMQYDSSANSLKVVNTGTGSTAIAVTSAHTSVSAVTIASSGVIADNMASLTVSAAGNLASGGNILRLSYATGAPDPAAVIFEIAGASSKDIVGISAVCAGFTNHPYYFESTGNVASGKAVIYATCSGTPNAASYLIGAVAAQDMYGVYVSTSTATNHVIYGTTAGTLGAGRAVVYATVGAAPNAGAYLIGAVAAQDCYGVYVSTSTATNHVIYGSTAGTLGSGKAVVYATLGAAPNAAAALVRADAAQDCYGIYSDVNATTNHCNVFNTGANTAANKAIVWIGADAGTPDALACGLIVDMTAATLSNNPNAVYVKSAGTGSQVYIESTYAGTSGAAITLYHNRNGAANDYPFTITSMGKDDAGNSQQWGAIKIKETVAAHGTEASTMEFYVADGGGNSDLMLALSANKLIVGKDGNAYLSSFGAYDLIIETNDGTNSGTITIADGVNGNITVAPNGTGSTVANGLAAKFHGTAVTSANDGAIAVTECIRYYDTTGAAACADTLPDISTNYGYFIMLYMKTDGAADAVVTAVGADKIVVSSASAANTSVTLNDAGDFCFLFASAPAVWSVIVNSGCTIA